MLAVIGNIPRTFHTVDLRSYFSTEIEEGKLKR